MSLVLDETSIRTSRPGLMQANGSRSLERLLGRHGRRRFTYASTGRRAWSRQMNADADDQRHRRRLLARYDGAEPRRHRNVRTHSRNWMTLSAIELYELWAPAWADVIVVSNLCNKSQLIIATESFIYHINFTFEWHGDHTFFYNIAIDPVHCKTSVYYTA